MSHDHQAGRAVHALRLRSALQHARERLGTAREEELRRILRALPDGLGTDLTSQALTLVVPRKLRRRDPARADKPLTGLRDQSQTAVADLRRLVYDVRPPALDDLGLVRALREHAGHYARTGLGS